MIINPKKQLCYRICHIQNINHILKVGLCTKHHILADPNFIPIGNPQIINTRDITPVRIPGYGRIGDYVPFYFTPRSIMLFNIVTGYWAPVVPQIQREDILVIRCNVRQLITLGRFFFTDGQANDAITHHYNDVSNSNKIDWNSIQNSNFAKSNGDFDRARRYQAEFLVHHHVPLSHIESFNVYNQKAATFVQNELIQAGISGIQVHIQPYYFF